MFSEEKYKKYYIIGHFTPQFTNHGPKNVQERHVNYFVDNFKFKHTIYSQFFVLRS